MNKKISDFSGLLTTTALNTKIEEFENKILDVSGLVKKQDYIAKISGIETSDYIKFASKILETEIKEK